MKCIFEQSRLSFVLLTLLALIEVSCIKQFWCVVGENLMLSRHQIPLANSKGKQTRGVDPFSNQIRMVWGHYMTTPPGGLGSMPARWKEELLVLATR